VLGSKAAYVKVLPDSQQPSLRAQSGAGEEPESAWGRVGTPGQMRPVPTAPGRYADYYAELAVALATGAAPPVTIEEAVAVMTVIEAAQRSAATSAVVRL
jgi:predicted dehydrogenase